MVFESYLNKTFDAFVFEFFLCTILVGFVGFCGFLWAFVGFVGLVCLVGLTILCM